MLSGKRDRSKSVMKRNRKSKSSKFNVKNKSLFEQKKIIEKEVIKIVKKLNKIDEKNNKDEFISKWYYDFEYKNIFLTVEQVKDTIKNNTSIKVIEPQNYNKLSTLNSKSYMLTSIDKEMPLGYFNIDLFNPKFVSSGSGSDLWIVANEDTLKYLIKYCSKKKIKI
jgi:hypothetical protein